MIFREMLTPKCPFGKSYGSLSLLGVERSHHYHQLVQYFMVSGMVLVAVTYHMCSESRPIRACCAGVVEINLLVSVPNIQLCLLARGDPLFSVVSLVLVVTGGGVCTHGSSPLGNHGFRSRSEMRLKPSG